MFDILFPEANIKYDHILFLSWFLFFQVILQSETIQELTKTSQALGSSQQEAS